MNLFSKLEEGYENLWKMVIRPPRCTYPISELGPQTFVLEGIQVKRIDVQFTNPRGLLIYGSHFIPLSQQQYSCVIYLHRNSSNRTEGMEYLSQLIKNGMSLMTFDFAGCGNSEGQYISLGWYEWEDLAETVKYLRSKPQVTGIGVWGRSMGAVTALMYLKKDHDIKAAVFDSPFKSLQSLIEDLCKKNSKIPMFILAGAVKIISKTIQDRAKFDIYKLNPLKTEVPHITTPGLFIVSKQDQLVDPKHSDLIFKAYPAPKDIIVAPGMHNTKRPDKCIRDIVRFFKKYLSSNRPEQFVLEPQYQKDSIDFFAQLHKEEEDMPKHQGQKIDFFAESAAQKAHQDTTAATGLASLGHFLHKLNPFSHAEKKQDHLPDPFAQLKQIISKTYSVDKSRHSFKLIEQSKRRAIKVKEQPRDNTFQSQLTTNINLWSFK